MGSPESLLVYSGVSVVQNRAVQCCIVAGGFTETTVGYYRVRAVDYWSRPSSFSPVTHYPAVWS